MKKNTFITTLLFMITATSLCNSQKIVAGMVNLKNNNSRHITPIVAITGINNETPEGFSFVALTEISAGTIIYFTDKEFDNTTLTFNAYESVASWTAPSGGVFRGEVIAVKETTTANVYTTYCNSGNCGSVTQISGSFSLAAKGETFYAYSDSNANPSDGITEIYSALYTGNSSISGGDIPTVEDPSTIYIGAVVVDGFIATAPNRTEYNPSLRGVSVDQVNFQNTNNWLHAEINQDLSATPFTNIIIANTPPIFTSTPVLAVNDNETYAYSITTDDIDDDEVVVTAISLPSWLTLNTAGTILTGEAVGQVGMHTVVLNANDGNGGSVNQSFTIIVSDATPPTIVTQNITIQLDEFGALLTIAVEDIDNGSTDASGIDAMTIDMSTFTCDNVGENTVTLTAIDVHGNSASGEAIVIVEDQIAPIVIAVAPFTLQLDEYGSDILMTASQIDNGSTDNCGIESMTIDKETFDCSNVGENTVTLTVTDINGNTAIATTTVTIEDVTVPIVITQDITIELNSDGEAFITTDDIDDGSMDNCGIASMSLDRTGFECATLGGYTVTLTVTDTSGNITTEISTVTVAASDIDGDLIADYCDDDIDGDGVNNDFDNCIVSYNPDQDDVDFNGVGDVCDESELSFIEGTGFSPNGDGIRDTFVIEGLHEYPDNELEIYNRWGNKVFSTQFYQNDWDGVARGNGVFNKNEKLPAAPYFYVLKVGYNQVFKGWIYINY